MAKTASLDALITKHAAEFAEHVRAVAAVADKEEEIRIEVENQLAFLKREGVTLKGKHEVTVASGRIDSVYQRVIIEYKNPSSAAKIGETLDSPGSKKLVTQIQNRFRDLQTELGHPITSLFGVGCDGKRFIFIRWRDKKWDVQQPVEVNKHTAERFLWALFNLGTKGKAFRPEYLAADFGSNPGSIALDGIPILYDAIRKAKSPKAKTFFNQWKILFGEVCGYDVENPSDKMKKLAKSYGVGSTSGAKVNPAELLFAVHTYYAVFMKLLASGVVAKFHKLPDPVNKLHHAATPKKFRAEMEELEKGSIFRHFNITNFLEGDLFAWYLPEWSDEIYEFLKGIVSKFDDYNPQTLAEEPNVSRDLLKKLYQELFPKSVRHDLGEYYTPDWLAEHVLNEVGYDGDPDKRILDPACGSGTFLVLAINRIRQWYEQNREKVNYEEDELARKILANCIGFDLNPLAVMAARTNYLIAIRGLIDRLDRIEIPVYLCDSILTPSTYGGLFAGETNAAKELKTAAAKFIVPVEIAQSSDDVGRYADVIEQCVQNGYSPTEFIERCQAEGLPVSKKTLHTDLYKQLVALDKANNNGVWARIIKNSFAPLFVRKVDFVVGNPPWILWDNLPHDYRDSTKPLWEHYGLFTLSASAARHGGGKKDICMLMLYVSADAYLRDEGHLGFVLTQTLLQSKGAGDGFRRFRLRATGPWLGVTRVDDLVAFQPFEGAANWTSTLILSKGEQTTYPVPYYKWEKLGDLPEGLTPDWQDRFALECFDAAPIDSARPTSPWALTPSNMTTDWRALVAPSDYSAHLGANSGGANAVYWLDIHRKVGSRDMFIENIIGKSKAYVPETQATIETDLLYPLIRWLDVSRYNAVPAAYLLLAQNPETRTGITEAVMRQKYPKSYAYLSKFKKMLLSRAAYRRYQGDAPFYSMYNVDEYTVAPIKVVWRRMDRQINAAVVTEVEDQYLGKRPVIPQETCVLVECHSEDEAHYICATVNSAISNFIVKAHSVKGGKGFGTPSMLDYLPIKRFNKKEATHRNLAQLSREAHSLAASEQDFSQIQHQIDTTVATMWGLTKADALAIASSLE